MSGAFPPAPHTSDMTFWSRYDPVAQPKGNTDHWSNMKIRSSMGSPAAGRDGDVMTSWMSRAGFSWCTGGKSRLADQSFDDHIQGSLQGNLPGSYDKLRPRTTLPDITLRNSYHDRAKDGFRYWLVEKPKPTSYGRYGIGSFKTVLGVGNAPRT
ncbi:LOW QUALITY PROTEIN: uncharacterized protein LOC124281966 [Haliotis rubra]|uniref:LOW QUALITY PROTEIN: uncharacterized protein LOC124281966 n=1 Tax=Haliotis rubra TaxID=36100 RepID=UPI001EE5C209|nr:LOW QUALITY PROTEIN: uncharacterized protein LOC124281966 [Haliotis rubra]